MGKRAQRFKNNKIYFSDIFWKVKNSHGRIIDDGLLYYELWFMNDSVEYIRKKLLMKVAPSATDRNRNVCVWM